jgi:catechol 2,3-dioxygenase-like lactoylglutathione lyase family enzyme
MFQAIERLLTTYERGGFTRRELLVGLAALTASGTSVRANAQTASNASGVRINHINLRVSNMQRSVDFFGKLFGPGFRQHPTMTPYDLSGGTMDPYMSLQNDQGVATEGRLQYEPRWHSSLTTKPGTWEHIAFEVDNLDFDKTMATLKAFGCDATKQGDFIWTHEPDGALIQIVPANSQSATSGRRLTPLPR